MRRAAGRLPGKKRERYEAEWLAELEALRGLKLGKLVFALSILRGSARLRRDLVPSRKRRSVLARLRVRTLRHLVLLQTITYVAFAGLWADASFGVIRYGRVLTWVLFGVVATVTPPGIVVFTIRTRKLKALKAEIRALRAARAAPPAR